MGIDRDARALYSIAIGGAGGYLGVELKEYSNPNYQQLGLSSVRGVAIEKVLKNTPAEKAGLQDGDVIVSFNGESVTSTRKLTRMISEVAPDHTVSLTVVRNGGEIEIPVTVGERKGISFARGDFEFPAPPMPPAAPDAPPAPVFPRMPRTPGAPSIQVFPGEDGRVFGFSSGRRMGLGTMSLTKQLGEFFGVEDGKGILITSVSKDGPGATAGLRAGDVIVEVDGKAVDNQMDLLRTAVRDGDGPVVLTIVRDRNRQTISVTPESSENGDLLRSYEYRTRVRESN